MARSIFDDIADSLGNVAQNITQGVQKWATTPQQSARPTPQPFNTSKSTYNAYDLVNHPSETLNSNRRFELIPQVSLPNEVSNVPVLGGLGNFAVNLPGTAINPITRVPVELGADAGRIATSRLNNTPSPSYSQLQSPISKLGYQLRTAVTPQDTQGYGVNMQPQETLKNAGDIGESALSLLTSVSAPSAIKSGIQNIGNQSLKNTVATTAVKSFPIGYGYGFSQGLQQNSGYSVQEQLLRANQQGLLSGTATAILGAAAAGATYKLSRVGKYQPFYSDEEKALMRELNSGKSLDQIAQEGKYSIGAMQTVSQRQNGLGVLADLDNAIKAKNRKAIENAVYVIANAPDNSPLVPYKTSLQQYVPQGQAYAGNVAQSGKINFGADIQNPFKSNNPTQEEIQRALNEGRITLDEAQGLGGKNLIDPIANVQRVGQILKQQGFNNGNGGNGGKGIPNNPGDFLTGEIKERKFITSVKESSDTPKAVKDIISGSYIVKSNDELKKAAKQLIKQSPQAAEELALNPRSDVDVQVGNELVRHYASIGDYQKAKKLIEGMAESGTDLGRAVQAYSLYDKTSPEGALKFAQSKVREYNKINPGQKLDISDDLVKSLFDKASKIQEMPQGKERNIASQELLDQINELIPSTVGDKAIVVWKAGLLTSLRTHERNLLGNTIHQGAEIVKDLPASLADQAMAARTGQRTTTFTTQGLGEGTKKGLILAKNIVQTGFDPEEDITKYDVKKITWGKNPVEQTLKKYTDTVFNTLAAEDKPFWNAAFARSMYDQAGAEAINAGKAGDKVFIRTLVQNPTEKMKLTATKDANIATFHDPNKFSAVANALKQALSQNELTKIGGEVLAPFTGVPSSIANQMVSYSPIGLTKGAITAGRVMAGQVPELQRQAAQEIGRGVVGSGLLGIGAYLVSKGLMTGQPKDLKESQQWQLEGKQPNSILIGGKWRSIGSVGPELLLSLAGAKAQEELQKGKDASVGTYFGNVGKDFLGQTFLQGVQQPLAAINDPARYGQSYVGNQISSIIPNIVKDTSKAFDDKVRENNSTLDYVTNAIPGLRNQNIEKRDNLGNVIPQEPTGLGAYIDLFNSKTPISNPVIDELARLNNANQNATPSKLNKDQTIQGVKTTLTPQQLNELEAQMGPEVTKALEQLIQTPEYQALSDEEKANAIGQTVTKVRKAVRGTFTLGSTNMQPLSQQSTDGIYTLIDAKGNVKRIDLSSAISKPQMTGNSELDKALMSKYNSALTSRTKDVIDLYNAGKISANEAEKILQSLKGSKVSLVANRKAKVKKVKLAKTKIGKQVRIKVKKAKAFKVQLSRLKTSSKQKA